MECPLSVGDEGEVAARTPDGVDEWIRANSAAADSPEPEPATPADELGGDGRRTLRIWGESPGARAYGCAHGAPAAGGQLRGAGELPGRRNFGFRV